MGARICLAWTSPDKLDALFMASVIGALRSAPDEYDEPIQWVYGPLIAKARNGMTRQFLDERSAPWLLMIDSDVVFDTTAPLELLDVAKPRKRPIIGGLYAACGRNDGRLHPEAFDVPAGEEVVPIEWPSNSEPLEVDAVGAGFLLVRREVLAAAEADGVDPWFGHDRDGAFDRDEDVTFCLRMRERGYPVHVAPSVRVGHVRRHVITAPK